MDTDDTHGERIQHHHAHHSALALARLKRFGAPPRIGRSRREPTRRSTRLSAGGNLFWKIVAGKSGPGHARGLLRAWVAWERLSEIMWPTAEVPQAPNGLLRVRIELYRREPVTLPGGVEIVPGAPVGELHCKNRALLRLMLTSRNPFTACRQDLRGLAQWMEADPLGQQAVALHARTLFAKVARRYGFTPIPTPITVRRRLERIFFVGLLMVYSNEGARRVLHGTTHHGYPQDIWITRDEFLRKYLTAGDRGMKRSRRDAQFSSREEGAASTPASPYTN